MIMEKIALYLGFGIIICLALGVLLFLIWILYQGYDYWLKKLLGWDNIKNRKAILYYAKHQDEIKKIIEQKMGE